MSHVVRFLFIGTMLHPYPFNPLPKPRVCIHRPPDAGAQYYWVRMDYKPVTDADLDEVARCDICYPVKKDVLIDNRVTT